MVKDGWDAPELADEQPDDDFLARADPRSLDEQLKQFDRSWYDYDAQSYSVRSSLPPGPLLLVRVGVVILLLLGVGGALGGALGWWSE